MYAEVRQIFMPVWLTSLVLVPPRSEAGLSECRATHQTGHNREPWEQGLICRGMSFIYGLNMKTTCWQEWAALCWESSSRANSLPRINQSSAPLIGFRRVFVALVAVNRKRKAGRRLSGERKLLWLLHQPQNDWVLGLFQLLHCWAATACEYDINMEPKMILVFEVEDGTKCVLVENRLRNEQNFHLTQAVEMVNIHSFALRNVSLGGFSRLSK